MAITHLSDKELLAAFLEQSTDFRSASAIARWEEVKFVDTYANYFDGGRSEARKVYKTAVATSERTALIWANIKDTVASPYMENTLFNNIPHSFIKKQEALPNYEKLFGAITLNDCDHCKSIFGPAAYFVDLMRFIDETITLKQIDSQLKLENRQPSLFHIDLDCDNTYTLIPFIDIVNEILEAVVRDPLMPDAYEKAAQATYPMGLPYNLPHAQVRDYLEAMGTHLYEIYNAFDLVTNPDTENNAESGPISREGQIGREILNLSPIEYELISKSHADQKELLSFFGTSKSEGLAALSYVETFLERTGLTKDQLSELIYQDLSPNEINAGLSRAFFINNVGDNLPPISVVIDDSDSNNLVEKLTNLSFPRLDAISRFLMLARKLDWSFADLEWALRSTQSDLDVEKVLKFDGVNDFVACKVKTGITKTAVGNGFTIEAWVQPEGEANQVIFCSGNAAENKALLIVMIDYAGRLCFLSPENSKNKTDEKDILISGYHTIPQGQFTHIAVTLDRSKSKDQVSFFINGKLDVTKSEIGAHHFPASDNLFETDIYIGRNFNDHYFEGIIKEIRFWKGIRTQEEISSNRYARFSGKEPKLLGYWPLSQTNWNNLPDLTANRNDGIPGGDGFVTQPRWVERDLILDPLPAGPSPGTPPTKESLTNLDLDFWKKDRLALVDFSTDDNVRNHPDLRRRTTNLSKRTVQVWFKAEDIYLSHRKQVIYQEGEAEGGLNIYLHEGYLYFGAYTDSDAVNPVWEKTFLRTNQLVSGQWYHAAIVLDASANIADEAFRAYVDGRLVDTGPAAKITKYNGKVELGGASNGARFHDGKYLANETPVVESPTFKGMILEFQLWVSAFNAEKIRKTRFTPIKDTNAGLLEWSGNWTRINAERLEKIGSLPANLPPVELKRETLLNLSGIERLQKKHDISIDRLCALWYTLKHTGSADGEVLFDTVFNPLKKDYEYWEYYADQPVVWDRSGENDPKNDQVTQSRLRGSLRLSQKDLNALMDGIVGDQITVSLTNDMLNRMYRLSQFAKVLKLKIEDFMNLLDIMQMEDIQEINDFIHISKRADWLKLTGLKVYELDFIIYDTPNDKIRGVWSEADLRGLSDDLLKQGVDFLASENAFIMEGIDEGRSGELFSTLLLENFIGLYVADLGDESLDLYTVEDSVIDRVALEAVYDTIGWLEGEDGLALRVQITEILLRKNEEHYNACIEGLTGLFGSEPELVKVLFEYYELDVSPADFLVLMAEIEEEELIAEAIEAYLDGYEKVLFIAAKFSLNPGEVSYVLDNPEWFGLEDITSPDINEVDNLFNFKALSTNFKDEEDRLVGILAASTDEEPEEGEPTIMEALADLAGWEVVRLERLVTALGFEDRYNTVEHIDILYQCFEIAESLQSDVDFLISLADTRKLDYDYYRNHADTLLNIFHAQYDDNEAWNKVYRPVQNNLNEQKRDALTSLAMLRIPDTYNGRRSPDLLTEFLLIDVQMGGETDTSRIVQATLSAQLYVQRCLMNLEANISPEIIPEIQWSWMKNYRVWEANRKVFLYPENYIEPELRDTKSPLFKELEDQLMQGDVNDDTVAQAYTNYLDGFVQLSNLKIVGSSLQVDTPAIPFTYGLDFNPNSAQLSIGGANTASSLVKKNFTVTAWVFLKSIPKYGGIIGCLKNEYSDVTYQYYYDPIKGFRIKKTIVYNEEKGWLLGTHQGRFCIALSTKGADKSDRKGVLTYLKAPASHSKTNSWTHLSATYNGTSLKLYVNGEKVAETKNQSGDILYPPNSTALMIGRYEDRYNKNTTDGHMLDLRLFDRALTADHIKNIMKGDLPESRGVSLSPEAWWKMNEGEGMTIMDHSEGNLNLSRPGSVNWVKVKDQAAALRQAEDVSEKEKILYLVGRTETDPFTYYYRKNEVGKKWFPWQKIDLSIKAEYVTPVFAFGRLFIFWAEIKESTESRETKDKDKNGNYITENVTVFTPIIKYSYLNFANAWVQEQTYAKLQENISEFETQLLKWQRIYVQQSLEFEADYPKEGKTVVPDTVSVLRMGTDSAPYLANPLASGKALDSFAVSFWLLWNKPPKSAERKNAEDAIPPAEAKVAGLEGAVGKADANVNTAKNTLSDLQKQLKEAKDLKAIKELELSKETSDIKKKTLKKLINSLIVKINDFNNKILTAQMQFETAKTTLAAKQKELAAAKKELANAEKNLKDIITREENALKNQVIYQYGGGEFIFLLEHLIVDNDTTKPLEERLGISDAAWTHLYFNIVFASGKYTISILKDASILKIYNLSIDQMSPGLSMEIGSKSKFEDQPNNFDGQMTEFVVWSDVMPESLILEQKDVRVTLEQQQTLLGYASLIADDKKGLEVYDEVQGTTLALADAPFRNIEQPKERERILLFYGNVIRSMRSNLKEYSFKLNLQKNENPVNSYDVNIWQSKLYLENNAPLGLLDYSGDSQELLELADEADSDLNEAITKYQTWIQSHSPIRLWLGLGMIYTIDLFQKQRAAVHGKFIGDLQRISAMMDLLKHQYSNSEDASKVFLRNLPNAEASFTDINNQPGWYVLDTGDEQFLMKKKEIDDYPLKTVSERLLFNYEDIDRDSSTETQDMTIILEEDPALTTDEDPNPEYTLERLNTNILYTLSEALFKDGIDGLLSIESQQLRELDFGRFSPNEKLLPDEVIEELGFEGALGLYYREVFFHIPFYIGNQLNSNQKFEEAQKWYHYIFNPMARESDSEGLANANDRYWRYLPFRNQNIESFEKILTNAEALAEYHEDPFDPHAIARLRINAYQKAVVMKYIDNLLDWGDSLFRQDSRESINEATLLYILAYNILGERPKPLIQEKTVVTGTYASVREEQDKNIPEFLTPEVTTEPGTSPYTPNHHMEYNFCIPENENFVGYWDRVEDRLFKIRHSLNIDGIFRTLALFQPPIDPMALVRAAAGGRDIGSVLSGFNVSVPHYRYSYMLDKARNLVGTVQALGGALLDAIEKKDAEELSILQNTQEQAILNLTTAIKEHERDAAQANLDGLRISLDGAKFNKQHYEGLITAGLSGLEITQLVMEGVSQALKLSATITTAVAAAGAAIPNFTAGGAGVFGSPVATVTTGGGSVATTAEKVAKGLEIGADIASAVGSITGTLASYERREGEWKFERDKSDFEIKNLKTQIEAAEYSLKTADQEILIHKRSIQHNKQVEDFMKSKFSNKALYNWMVTRISGLYFQTYKIAYDMAKLAEKALQYEFGVDNTYINFGHWDSLKKGLLAGESLELDLNRMEKAAIDMDSRYLEIEKVISLRHLNPMALVDLKNKGECEFEFTEKLFDYDYPGHYFRVIKALSITIPVVVGPYQTVKATLTQLRSDTLLSPDTDGLDYLLGVSETSSPSVRTNWRAYQSIAISKGVNDSGLFELNFNDDRYLPFEGTGAVSKWKLSMPKATNHFDFDTLSDVIINLKYTAAQDRGLKKAVEGLLEDYSGSSVFSLAQENPAGWHQFLQSESPHKLSFTLSPQAFPYNLKDIAIEEAYLLAVGNAEELENRKFALMVGDAMEPAAEFEFEETGKIMVDEAVNIDPKEVLSIISEDDNLEGLENLLLMVSYKGGLDW